MANEEEVGVRITATTSDFTEGTDKAKAGLESVADGAAELKETLMTVAEAMGAMWAVDKIEEFTEHMAALGEQVEHTAAMTGLSVGQVQDFQYAVEATGGTTENANLALVQLERHIAEAAQGVGDASDAFTRLGVSQKELKGGDVNEIMKTMADTMHNTADGANKVEAMYRAVGRSGAQLIPIFDLGSKAVDEMNQKFQETGAQMSEGMAQQLTLMAQQMYLAESASTGVSNSFATQLLPSINAALVGITGFREGLSKAVANSTGLGEAIHFLGAVMDGTLALVMGLATGIEQLADIAIAAGNAIITEWNSVAQVMEDFWDAKFPKMMTDAKAGFALAGSQMTDGFKNANAQGQQYIQTLEKMMDAYNGAKVGIGLGRGDENNPMKPPKAPPTDDIGGQRALYAQQYEAKKEYDQLMVQSGAMSNEQELADLTQALNTEKDEVEAAFQRDAAQYSSDTAKYRQLMDEKAVADQRFANQHMQLMLQLTNKDAQMWQSSINEINKDMDGMVSNFFTRTETMGQAFQKMCQSMAIEFTQAIVKSIAENALLTLAQQQGWTQMSAALTKNLGEWITTENAKTNAAIAAAATRTAASNTEEAAGASTAKAAASSSIMTDAGEAAAAVYADVAQIPYVGWILAPPAAAAAFAAVAAYDSFAVGTDYVPHDMVAQIHKGEMIVPASANKSGAAPYTGGGGSGSDTHVHFHTAALDSHTAAAMWSRNAGGVAKAVKQAARGNSAGIKSAFARM